MKVRRRCVWYAWLVMIPAMSAAGFAQEAAGAFSAEAAVDYYSRYVWRGQTVNDESVFQTNVSGSFHGFTGSIWANHDLTDDRRGEFSEVDYAVDYSRDLSSRVGVSLGVIHYLFPNTEAAATTEIYGSLAFKVPLSPEIAWYRDVNEVDGSYIQIRAGHEFSEVVRWENGCSMGVSVSGSLAFAGKGYNMGYFGLEETLVNDFTLGVRAPIDLKVLTLTPSFNFSTMVDDGIGAAVQDRNAVWFGVGISKSF